MPCATWVGSSHGRLLAAGSSVRLGVFHVGLSCLGMGRCSCAFSSGKRGQPGLPGPSRGGRAGASGGDMWPLEGPEEEVVDSGWRRQRGAERTQRERLEQRRLRQRPESAGPGPWARQRRAWVRCPGEDRCRPGLLGQEGTGLPCCSRLSAVPSPVDRAVAAPQGARLLVRPALPHAQLSVHLLYRNGPGRPASQRRCWGRARVGSAPGTGAGRRLPLVLEEPLTHSFIRSFISKTLGPAGMCPGPSQAAGWSDGELGLHSSA